MKVMSDKTSESEYVSNLRNTIRGAERLGLPPPRYIYENAQLPVPKKATDEFQDPPLWRRIINFWRP